jgi:hypothetical protein
MVVARFPCARPEQGGTQVEWLGWRVDAILAWNGSCTVTYDHENGEFVIVAKGEGLVNPPIGFSYENS